MEWIIIIRGPLLLLARDLEILGDGPWLDIALYMQGIKVWIPVIPLIHFKGGISSH
jgi:hypothetical protein